MCGCVVAARVGSLALALSVGVTAHAEVDAQGGGTEVIDDMRIYQLQTAIKEGNEGHWAVRLDKPKVQSGTEGYRPSGGAASVWGPEVEFLWNFGDDTGWISTGERPSVTHRYMELGDYELRVKARSAAGTIEDWKPVRILDRDYFSPSIKAILIDPASTTYEFTAAVGNTAQDDVVVSWQFGDSSPAVSGVDLWRVTRSFAGVPRQDVTVTWMGDDGTEIQKELSFEPEPEPDFTGLEEFDRQVVAEGVRTRFEGSFGGGLPASDLRAEVRAFAGLFLGATSKGQCRFLMTAWDPEMLAMVQLIANVPGIPEKGWRFQYPASISSLSVEPSAEEYLAAYSKSGFNESVLGQLGQLGGLGGIAGDRRISEAQVNAKLRQKGAGFVQYGAREQQFVKVREGGTERIVNIDGGSPVAASPLIRKEESFGGDYSGARGNVQILFVPHERVVGVVDVRLQGGATYDRLTCVKGRQVKDGVCKPLHLEGRFVLDLKAAPRDGLVMYDGCAAEPSFRIKRIYGPEFEELHVRNRQPAVVVSFSGKIDPETLNESTLQLGYFGSGSGDFVPIESRLLRDEKHVVLKPAEEVWGGVTYVARIKTGERGVRGRNGAFLKADGFEHLDGQGPDRDAWYILRTFGTRLDLAPRAGALQNLSCHVWQGARDAPLIVGKEAVVQVRATWRRRPEVQANAQMRRFDARVLLEKNVAGSWVEIARANHEFERPDLVSVRGPESKDTANMTFVPDRSIAETLRVRLEVDRQTSQDRWWPFYTTLCSTPVWKHEPRLAIVLLPPAGEQIPGDDLESIASQLRSNLAIRFPLRTVDVRIGEPFDPGRPPGQTSAQETSGQIARDALRTAGYWIRLREDLRRRIARESEEGGADLIVLLNRDFDETMPHTVASSFVDSFPAVLAQNYLTDTVTTTGSLMHQVGHVLGLPDVPLDGPAVGTFGSHVRAGESLEWHDGFAHAIKHSEGGWYFFSSTTGGFTEIPLMEPRALGPVNRIPLRHHYLRAMEVIEDSVLTDP